MNPSKPAPGVIVLTGFAVLSVLALFAALPPSAPQKIAHYSVQIVDSRGAWIKTHSPQTALHSSHDLSVRCGTTLELNFESVDYVYMLSQSQLGIDLVLLPQQSCTTRVVVATPGRYDIVARGFCGDLWQHSDPPLRIVCHP